MKLYAIYDVKADALKQQFFLFDNDEVCKRAFKGVIANPPAPMQELAQYSEDFFIYRIADVDLHSTGTFDLGSGGRVCCLNDLKVVS